MRRPARLLALAATLGLSLAAPAAAPAIPFGANLNLPANVAFDCTASPLPNAFGTGFVLVPVPNGAQTCSWMAVGTANQPAEGSFLAPVAGTVTQVSARVGPVTGPMQVIVLRSFRDFFSTASPVCCTEVARTPVFTPAPNAVTTIQTALPVRKDTVPDPVNRTVTFDALALSVLAPGVPVPAFDSGRHNPADFGAPSAIAYHPAVGPGQEAFASGSGVGGFQVLLAADVTPSATGQGPAGGGPTGTAPAAIRLVQPAATVRDGRAPVVITCGLAAGRCVGVLRLQSRAGAAGGRAAAVAAKRRRTVTYGSARISVSAGRRATVSVALTRAGRALLRRHARRTVWLNATVGRRAVPAVRLTLRRPDAGR
ncbi:MAG TPA: hypothetical protein VGO48_10060 [Conexibacter sp.]|jgi:hypothetical protein|nr:hypothetical protein [Conexibacter sp.]